MIKRGEKLAEMSLSSRSRISELGYEFIRDGAVVLTHGRSRVVTALLKKAAEKTNFTVITTEGRPDGSGYKAAIEYIKHGIPTTVILDSAMGYIMERVDIVIVGAEGVVESGGVVNKIGTCQLAMLAKTLNKPFYVAAESYKFARFYPLSQRDLPESKDMQLKLNPCTDVFTKLPEELDIENPSCDYTPPRYITLLFTDLGILTPAAVSDELIRLYQ